MQNFFFPRIKDRVHVINFNGKNSKGTYWVSLLIDKNAAVYFDSFGNEYIFIEALNKIRDKLIIHNIFRIENNEFIMCRFYCIAVIEFMHAGKSLLDYTNSFSPNDFKN